MEWAPIVMGLLSPLRRLVLFLASSLTSKRYFWNKADGATYSYNLWIKHLTLLQHWGMAFPAAVAEIGPGDTLGLGVAAVLSGVKVYHGYDVKPYADTQRSVVLVDELARMLRTREPCRPKGFPEFERLLPADHFPHDILTDERLRGSLTDERIRDVRRSIEGEGDLIRYRAPWASTGFERSACDLVLSHSVLEYVDDLDSFMRAVHDLLKPGGWTSHQIDLSSLRITRAWNGHLAYPEWLWRVVVGMRSHRPNRKLPADYLRAMRNAGLEVVEFTQLRRDGGLRRESMAEPFRSAPAEEVDCIAIFVVARRRANA
jgi:SAM-dependent methyltransferase